MADGPSRPAPATAFAAALLGAAVRGGVRDVVVCPGSRSQALALVAAELERLGRIRLHVRVDERSAAFFALGIARELGAPVPVITTSGTAVAELAPAMLEAFHAGVPLVALTADRPDELLGVGANQATRQPGLFGERVACHHEPAPTDAHGAAERGRRAGERLAAARAPLHLNVAFRDPLSSPIPDLASLLDRPVSEHGGATGGDHGDATAPVPRPAPPPLGGGEAVARIDPADGVPTLVIAGDLAGPEAEAVAHAGGWPLVAEVSSGARFGRNLVVAYRELLAASSPAPELRDAIGRVLVYGHPTLSREVPALVSRPGVEAIAVGPAGGEPYDPGHSVARHVDRVEVVAGGAPAAAAREWLRAWVRASHAAAARATSDAAAPDLDAARASGGAARSRFARTELAVAREPVDRELLVDAVWRATWPHDRLVVGASRLIRVLDGRAPGKRIRVHANRGLAGIDGTVATALGVAVASQAQGGSSAVGTTRVLLGDLALLHDAGSLLVGQGGEVAPRMQVIVGNDGGGTIFDGLEVGTSAPAVAAERVLYTPQRVELASLAAAYGWAHVRASTRAELEAALVGVGEHARVLIEVPLER